MGFLPSFIESLTLVYPPFLPLACLALSFVLCLPCFRVAFVIRLKADSTRAPFPLPWRILPFTLENAHLWLFCCLVNGFSFPYLSKNVDLECSLENDLFEFLPSNNLRQN
uniref:Uncharacterized protein n=1 Tax=Picea glauca TaxID=3330 RepID=A0A101LUC4_PICGL|nr:hypothetical protein ABT39_MTgene2552 [Picea glauca]